MKLLERLVKHQPLIPFYRRVRPRRCQVFGIGGPKTGTHSLVGLFDRRFRALHEAEAREQIALLHRWRLGQCDSNEIQLWFTRRDHRLWLELDASHLHGHFVAEIVEALPQAKFILTLRDPYSWLESAFNQSLGRPANEHWTLLRKIVYGPLPEQFAPEEQVLQQHGLYTLQSYLNRWAERIEIVQRYVPHDRLLILHTKNIKTSTEQIADFCGVKAQELAAHRGHQFTARKKFGLLEQIDPNYLRTHVEARCGALLTQYFSPR